MEMAEPVSRRPRRTPAERAAELDGKIQKLHQSIAELTERKRAAAAEFDAKIAAVQKKALGLEAQKSGILSPKPPRRTKKQKIEEIVRRAVKSGMSPEEVAGQLHLEIE